CGLDHPDDCPRPAVTLIQGLDSWHLTLLVHTLLFNWGFFADRFPLLDRYNRCWRKPMKPRSACPAIMLVTGSFFVVLLAAIDPNKPTTAPLLTLFGVIMNVCGFVSIVNFLRTGSGSEITRT